MNLLVVGSVALDSVRTPRAEVIDELGGSATYASLAASSLADTGIVAVVGSDFPGSSRDLLYNAAVDLEGLESVEGETFRWSGVYGEDPNDRSTLDTQLNVFADFEPKLPARCRDAPYLFLGNIHPALQTRVLDQVNAPKLVACDTMNFWIEGEREALDRVLPRIDLLLVNDEEVKLLSGETNLLIGARAILEVGPKAVVVKKGEHGAMLVTSEGLFVAPALPLASVIDPTGAGDSFAGGFMGRLTREKGFDEEALRRAIVWGTVTASFCVEHFGVRGVVEMSDEDHAARMAAYRETTRVAY
ncbi:MAG: sugar kinase [Gemmatimonadetes bacterium]|nr:sugar kinase [Gemmatimonadota bacterium]